MDGPQQIEVERIVEPVRPAIVGLHEWYGPIRPEAISQALAIDMQRAHVPSFDEFDLPSAETARAAQNLSAALNGSGPSFGLPFGTQVTVGRPGSIEIAGRIYVRRPHAPGLHPIETTPRDTTGPTLESLRLSIGNWASSSSANHLGMPLAGTMYDGGVRHVLDFAPLPELGGAVLQYDADIIDAARFCAAPVHSIEKFCKVLVKNAQWLMRHSARIARRVDEVRQAAEAGVRVADPYATAAALGRMIIDGRSIGLGNLPAIRVEYSGLDDSLRRGRLFDVVSGQDVVTDAGMRRIPLINLGRGTQSFHLRQLGADGRVDARAASIARAAPDGQPAVLRRLARDLETDVAFSSAEGEHHAILFWRDGVIRAEESGEGGLARLWQVFDQNGLSERLRHNHSSLPMAPFFDFAAGAQRPVAADHLQLGLTDELFLVNTITGAVWADTPQPN